jgi:hypothetical protein
LSIKRWNARRDANSKEVIDALRAAGASVVDVGQPLDLVVGYVGKTVLMEIKNPNSRYGRKGDNGNQKDFKATWQGGAVATVDSAEAALRVLGVMRRE